MRTRQGIGRECGSGVLAKRLRRKCAGELSPKSLRGEVFSQAAAFGCGAARSDDHHGAAFKRQQDSLRREPLQRFPARGPAGIVARGAIFLIDSRGLLGVASMYSCSENGANQRRACEHEHRYFAAPNGCLRPAPEVRFILSGVDVLKTRVYRRPCVTNQNWPCAVLRAAPAPHPFRSSGLPRARRCLPLVFPNAQGHGPCVRADLER